MSAHRTGTGHIPAAHAVSWACTCGEAEVWDYAESTPAEWAARLVALRAANHRALAILRQALQ
jgi:hypothetical protein